METLNKKHLQQIITVILKNDFQCSFEDIADVLKLKSHEAKELYLQLIRRMENHELAEKTQSNQTILDFAEAQTLQD